MKRILIPLNFSTTPVLYDSKQSFSASDESSGVLDFTTTADVTGTVASLNIRNSSENANRQTVLVDRIDVNSSPFNYTFAKPLSFGAYEGEILLKKNGVTVASATFLFGVNSSLSAEVLPKLVSAYSLDALVEEVETEIQNVKDAYNVTVSETVKGVNRTESTVQASENVRYLAEATRKSNELLRISQEAARVTAEEGRVTAFNTLVDTAVIEQTVTQEVAEKYQEIEALNSIEMVSMRQQLEQKADLADLPSSAYTFKGSTTFAALPTTGNTLGDVRYTTDNLVNYAWTGTAWTPIGNGAFANGSVNLAKTTRSLQSFLLNNNITRTANGKIIRLSDYVIGAYLAYTVSGDTTKVTVLGKNLINLSAIFGFNGNVIVTKIDDRIDIVNNNGYAAHAKLMLSLKPGTYTLSVSNSNTQQVAFYRNNIFIAGVLSGLDKSVTFTVTDEVYQYELKCLVAANGTGFVENLMFEFNSVKTDYARYQTAIDYTPGQEIMANDTVIVDGADISISYPTNQEKDTDSVLFGKKSIFDGDSICAASTVGVVGYPSLISTRNGMPVVNYGVDGGTIAYYPGKHCVSRNIPNMSADADYIIFEGGINDYWLNIPLGAVSVGYSTTLDDTTFCGALEQTFKNALLKWQGKKIGFIIVHKVYGTTASVSYWDKVREICKKWSIPYLDLYNESGLVYDLPDIKTAYSTNADGCHPNLAGYNVLVPKIEAWMKTL